MFHLSGKSRAECGAEGLWQGPPGVQLVLIGLQQQELQQLKQQLQQCLAASCSCASSMQKQQLQSRAHAAAVRFSKLVVQHHRFQLVPQPQERIPSLEHQHQQPHSVANGGPVAELVQFTAIGSILHGVVAAEVRGGGYAWVGA